MRKIYVSTISGGGIYTNGWHDLFLRYAVVGDGTTL
nr:hypothetical protein [Megasphaera genomosp. type_2]